MKTKSAQHQAELMAFGLYIANQNPTLADIRKEYGVSNKTVIQWIGELKAKGYNIITVGKWPEYHYEVRQ